jgi:cold shock CspA family protein
VKVISMIRGKVISFDRIKGYGFVAPDAGGEDVFIHVNDLLYSDKENLAAGSIVEFRLEEGERGPKAAAVTVLKPPASSDGRTGGHGAPGGPLSFVAAAEPRTGSEPLPVDRLPGDDETSDVLTTVEFAHEVTEALLRVEPELTAGQILEIRKRLARIGQDHGWVDR